LQLTDVHIAQGLRLGTPDSYEALYRKYYVPLCAFCAKYVKDDGVAEEIIQSLIIKIWEKRDQLNIPDELKLYLFKSAYNNCLSHLKKIGKRTFDDIVEIEDRIDSGLSHSIESIELALKIERSKEKLPDQTVKIFEMSRDHALTYPEIAEELNLSVKTVEYHMSKALKFFRIELQEFFTTLILFALGHSCFLVLNNYIAI